VVAPEVGVVEGEDSREEETDVGEAEEAKLEGERRVGGEDVLRRWELRLIERKKGQAQVRQSHKIKQKEAVVARYAVCCFVHN